MKSLLMLVAVVVCLVPLRVTACSCAEREQEALFALADAVFVAEVTTTRLIKGGVTQAPTSQANTQSVTTGPESVDVVEAEFRVIEPFKESVPPIRVVRDRSYGIGNCSIGLMAGMEYVFFVQKQGGGIPHYVGMCTGSAPINVEGNEFTTVRTQLRKYAVSSQSQNRRSADGTPPPR